MTAEIANRLSATFPRIGTRFYVRSKVKTDPLYEAVYSELRETSLPLLDLGCGIGLLAFYLRERGLAFRIAGLDYDPRKIADAHHAASRLNSGSLSFSTCDAREGLPQHRGNVTILDILQFFTPGERSILLAQAAECLPAGGRLVIRSGLRDESLRFKVTVAGDILARASFWMKAAPTHYPEAAELRSVLEPYGNVRIVPLWGGTPFNNHLIVLERPE